MVSTKHNLLHDILLPLMLLLLTFGGSSCKNDDEPTLKVAGTTWARAMSDKKTENIVFNKDGNAEYFTTTNDAVSSRVSRSSYTAEANFVIFNDKLEVFDYAPEPAMISRAQISGETMIVYMQVGEFRNIEYTYRKVN